MFNGGYKTRDKDKCKKKFDRMWQTKKPTGATEMPHYVRRAKEVKDSISEVEVIGYASLNSDDSCDGDGLAGTNLVDKNGTMKQPTTQKRKKAKLIDMMEDTKSSVSSSNQAVADSLLKLVGEIGKDNNTEEKNSKINKIEKDIDDFKNEVRSQFSTLNSTLASFLNRIEK